MKSGKANKALAPNFPIMILLMMVVIIIQVRSLSAMAIELMTAPLGVIGVVPTLLITCQPFDFNAILGLIALAGILMRNTLILISQIHDNERAGLWPYHAFVEATVQRSRPVILTALAAVLAFVPLIESVFWGSMAITLIGGTLGGTALTLVFYRLSTRFGSASVRRRQGTMIALHQDEQIIPKRSWSDGRCCKSEWYRKSESGPGPSRRTGAVAAR